MKNIKCQIKSEFSTMRKKKYISSTIPIIMALIGLLFTAGLAVGETKSDWITGFPRENINVKEWPGGKKVAVCFVLYVEVWGFGHGPNFRPDMVTRNPDLVDEAFRQYAVHWGIPRVGRLFKDKGYL